MVRTGTLMNQDTFQLISVFFIGRLLIIKKFVHIKHDRKGYVVFSLLPLESRDIKDKAQQREVQDRRETSEYQLPSGILQ